VSAPHAAESPAPSPSLRHRIEYVALRAFAGLVRVLGLSAGYFLARWAGSAIHAVDRRHRQIARANLRERFRAADGSPLPKAEVRRIARDSFRHLVCCAVEILHLSRESERRGLSKIVTLGGREHFDAAIASGKGLILATAHMGNWEVMGAMCRELGVPFTTVYRPLDNPLLDRWIRETRASVGQSMVPKAGAMRPLLKALRGGGMVVLLVDQDARGHGVFAPFFGAPASTIPTPAELALRTGATILTGASVRTGPGFRYDASFEPPIEVKDTGDHPADLVRITTEINSRIEALVRRAPEQWLWSHRRWKTKPPA
jgi:Kdo2-lipid IVA lauroyltransferase/acyltransferase